jgi:cathepsin D
MFFIGAPPTQFYQGTLQFLQVVDKYYWTLNLQDILVDDVSLGLCPHGCKVAVDSGTAYMGSPSKDLSTILHALTGKSAVSACQSPSNKTITYVMDGGYRLTLEPEYYFTKSIDGRYCKVKYIGLDVDPPHGPLHIFGDALFRKYFIHFDRDNDRVGFAVANKEINLQEQSLQSLLLAKLRSYF